MKQKNKKIFLLLITGLISTITFAQDSISKIAPSRPMPVVKAILKVVTIKNRD
jgi:hypothetical protein